MLRVTHVCILMFLFSFSTPNMTRLHGSGFREKRTTPDDSAVSRCCQSGRDGRDGRDGVQGPYGPPGQKGEPGPPGHVTFEARMEEVFESLRKRLLADFDGLVKSQLKNSYEASQQKIPGRIVSVSGETGSEREDSSETDFSSGGAVYTRWGRNSCPDHAQKLYNGMVAGSHYKHKGSGANHLCLPLDPQWNRTVAGHQSGSYLYGTEFQVKYPNTGFRQGEKSYDDHDVQCSVCFTPGRLSHVMIPARLECPAGWTKEYSGFIMSQHNTYSKSVYVSVDEDPDVHPGTSANENGDLLYQTEVVCGSLPCPPYVEGYEATCIVCTK